MKAKLVAKASYIDKPAHEDCDIVVSGKVSHVSSKSCYDYVDWDSGYSDPESKRVRQAEQLEHIWKRSLTQPTEIEVECQLDTETEAGDSRLAWLFRNCLFSTGDQSKSSLISDTGQPIRSRLIARAFMQPHFSSIHFHVDQYYLDYEKYSAYDTQELWRDSKVRPVQVFLTAYYLESNEESSVHREESFKAILHKGCLYASGIDELPFASAKYEERKVEAHNRIELHSENNSSVSGAACEELSYQARARVWKKAGTSPVLVTVLKHMSRTSTQEKRYWLYAGSIYQAPTDLTNDEAKVLIDVYVLQKEKLLERAKQATQSSGATQGSSKRQPIPDDVQIFVWQRDGGVCVKCGSNENLEFDHVIPVSKGGANTARNLQLLCETCNRTKSNQIGG